jgi:hypothetical protein
LTLLQSRGFARRVVDYALKSVSNQLNICKPNVFHLCPFDAWFQNLEAGLTRARVFQRSDKLIDTLSSRFGSLPHSLIVVRNYKFAFALRLVDGLICAGIRPSRSVYKSDRQHENERQSGM